MPWLKNSTLIYSIPALNGYEAHRIIQYQISLLILNPSICLFTLFPEKTFVFSFQVPHFSLYTILHRYPELQEFLLVEWLKMNQ